MSGREASPLLSIRGLSVEFRRRGAQPLAAVRDVDLDIPAGGIVALVGESGSGKTSLANAVLRLVPASAGRVLFRGEDLLTMDRATLRAARRWIQPVFQDPLSALSPRRRVLQTLVEPLDHFGVGAADERAALAARALDEVGLDAGLLDRYPNELSGGQRQRVALARALVARPALVIADEPVSSLDVRMQARVIDLVRQIRDRLGVAFLFVSHDLGVVRRLADSVAVMYAGRLVEHGPVQQLFTSPAHPYTRALLAAIPVADPDRPAPRVLTGEPPAPLTRPTGCVFHRRCTEALANCAGVEPGQRTLAGATDENEEHRVRCHLYDE